MASALFWETDVSPADWLQASLDSWQGNVGSVVPRGFAAYARVLHPLVEGECPEVEGRRWVDIARNNGRVPHRLMQFHDIVLPRGTPSPSPEEHDYMPGLGALAKRERTLLSELLVGETSTPESCWFCVWEGWGSIDDQGVTARVRLPNREYLLYRGPISAALAVPPQSATSGGVAFRCWAAPGEPRPAPPTLEEQARLLAEHWRFGPALWWPEDRAWVVATEIDFGWTYVGGSNAMIERLLAHPELDAWPADLDDRAAGSDPLNAALDAP